MTLTISAKDFGPIIEGTVELKPLTVFVGPSNTGKSYLATLIYALMEAKDRGPIHPSIRQSLMPWTIPSRHFMAIPDVVGEKNEEVAAAIYAWVQTVKKEDGEQHEIPFPSFPPQVQSLAHRAVESVLRATVEVFHKELERFHGEIADFSRRSSGEPNLHIALEQDCPALDLSIGVRNGQLCEMKKHFDLDKSKSRIHAEMIEELRLESESGQRTNQDWFMCAGLVATLVIDALNGLIGDFRGSCFYLPAARSGIAHGHKIIASTLVRQSPFAAIRPLEVPTFSGVIANFMGYLLTMGQDRREKLTPDLAGGVDFLERAVVGGKVNLEESELPYPEISYEPFAGQPYTGKFFLRQTSSMVSELAPVILFLKYLVRPGDLLILEEPEAHLHPASQRRMAQGIVRLVNAGVRVLITTHSDYFLNQVNNLMRIEYASDPWLEQAGFERADCLKHADVGAYVFHWDDAAGGSRVEQLAIRRDVGIDDQEFGKVVNEQYEETIMVEGVPLK